MTITLCIVIAILFVIAIGEAVLLFLMCGECVFWRDRSHYWCRAFTAAQNLLHQVGETVRP